MKKSERPREGICKLTGVRGRFVDSHLIPQALTRLSRTGEKFFESGIGHGVKRRATSWYDSQLVTQDGEDILAAIDARGIEALRQHKLIWSGWAQNEDMLAEFAFSGPAGGVRSVHVEQPEDLQLFFLSLLWRAAATARHEFADVRVPASVVEDLRQRQRVLNQAPGALADYPVQLFQLATRGTVHNRTPLSERKEMLSADGSWDAEVDYVRFYFDGLTSHIHLPQGAPMQNGYLRSCLGLGAGNGTLVFGHKYELSRASRDIKEIVAAFDAEQLRPPAKLSALAAATRSMANKGADSEQ